MTPLLPAALFLLAGAGVTAGAHLLVRARRAGGECGDFWARVVFLVIAILAPLTLVSGWLEVLRPTWWHGGRHLYLDLTGAFGWSVSTCYLVALAVPGAAWLAMLATTFFMRPADGGRWLAGGVGFTASRHWVLLFALPPAAAMLYALPRLGGGPGAYPGAAWSTLGALCLSLAGVALSAGQAADTGRDVDADAAGAASDADGSRTWPQAMQEGGLQLRTLVRWPARPPLGGSGGETRGGSGGERQGDARPVREGSARDLAERLRVMGARHVAPELIEALDDLLGAPADGPPPARLVLAPDDCGQVETTALAAHLVDRRYHAHTLVITAAGAGRLAERFGHWIAGSGVGSGAVAVTTSTEIPPPELVWVCDADTLSDHLLPRLQDPRRIERIGLVVWWNVHEYSGVLAANLWAISRRLHRLLRAHGRQDVRTLALLRNAQSEDAQVTRFVRRLLPLPAETPEVRVSSRCPKQVDVHLVESHHGFLTAAETSLEPRWQHLPLATARLSAEKGWNTCLDVPAELRDQAQGFLESLRGTSLEDRVRADAVDAGVYIHKVTDADVLALAERLSQGGRAVHPVSAHPVSAHPDIHHVGLIRPDNPYTAYLLERFGEGGSARSLGTSRRLISAEVQDRVMHRHLLQALAELPDTRGELLKSFLRNEEVLGRTLEGIAREGNLTRREVRHLDPRGRLVIDHQYQSRRPGERSPRPLGTVGVDLVEVRDPTGDGDGVCLRLDRERLTVEAYPQRVFVHDGRRYRVREWTSPEEIFERGWVACERHDVYSHTWRLRQTGIYDVEPTGSPVTVGSQGKSFTRCAARVTYEEEVTGVVRVTPKSSSTSWPRAESQAYEPIRTSFATRALLVGFPRPTDDKEAPVSLCQALRHVLPVHLGVREDDLELVPLQGYETPDSVFGLAVVDLYPGGIGLVDGLQDDDLLQRILGHTRDWLTSCRCKKARGCCLSTPSAKAAAMDYAPHHRAALELLGQVV